MRMMISRAALALLLTISATCVFATAANAAPSIRNGASAALQPRKQAEAVPILGPTAARNVSNTRPAQPGLKTAWKIAKCAAAIIAAIAGVAVPAAKVAKLKKLIKEVGGVKELAKRIVKVATGKGSLSKRIKEVFGDLGTAVVALAGEVLGIDAVANECF